MTEDPLWAALRQAHRIWAPETVDGFPPEPERDPPLGPMGTGKFHQDQRVITTVPTVPPVPAARHHTWSRPVEEAALLTRVDWEERAAIREFDGGIDRAEAEAMTAAELGQPPAWPEDGAS